MKLSENDTKCVFDDSTFPSSIKMIDWKGQITQQIKLDSSATAKDKFIETIKSDATKHGTFQAIHEAEFISRATELFEPVKINVLIKGEKIEEEQESVFKPSF